MKFELVNSGADGEPVVEVAQQPTEASPGTPRQGEHTELLRRQQHLENAADQASQQARAHARPMVESLARLGAKLEAEEARRRKTDCGQTAAEEPAPPNSFNASRFSHER